MNERITWMDFVLNDKVGPTLALDFERGPDRSNVMDDNSARKSDSVIRTLIQETEQVNEPARMVGDSFSVLETSEQTRLSPHTEVESTLSVASFNSRGAAGS